MLASTLLGRNYDPYTFNYSDGSGSYYGTCALNATYFELTDPNGYEISSNTKINISKKYLYFDEIARCSIYASNSPVCNRQAIISIPAVNDKNERLLYMDGKHCNTYQNQTKIMVRNGKIILVQDIITTLMYIKMVKPPQAELKLLYGVQDFLRRQT